MENIYFQPNKENSEFLAKLEKLDEYTIPQILERMVDHFRNLPELENALNKLGIRTESLEEDIDDDIEIKETFWLGGKPKTLEHFIDGFIIPILEKVWYKGGQLKQFTTYEIIYQDSKKVDNITKIKSKNYYIDGTLSIETDFNVKGEMGSAVTKDGYAYNTFEGFEKYYYRNGQLQLDKTYGKYGKEQYYDMEGNPFKNYTEFIEYKNKIRVSYEGIKGENFRNKYPFDASYDK